jgi:hypothetical protein
MLTNIAIIHEQEQEYALAEEDAPKMELSAESTADWLGHCTSRRWYGVWTICVRRIDVEDGTRD